jgi:hypothetical protein
MQESRDGTGGEEVKLLWLHFLEKHNRVAGGGGQFVNYC